MCIKITTIGWWGAYPSANDATSGYLLQSGNLNVLIDCGSGVLARLQNYIDLERLDAVVLSHYHWDHIADIGCLQYASRVLMEAGPQGGSLSAVRQVGAVAAGIDPVALDAWAYSLWGVGPNELPELFDLAEGMGLGRASLYLDAPMEIVTG